MLTYVMTALWFLGSAIACWRSNREPVQSYPEPLIVKFPRGPLATLVAGPCCGRTHPAPDPAEPFPHRFFYQGSERYAVYSWLYDHWHYNFMCGTEEYLRATSEPQKASVSNG